MTSMDLKILVVEDNDLNQRVFSWFLHSLGHSCDIVSTGAAALRAVTNHPYNIVFMDLCIPNMDGCTTASVIRQAGFTMPIIAVTAEDMPNNWQKCFEAGMNGYITKPFTKSDFADALRRWLPQAAQSSS